MFHICFAYVSYTAHILYVFTYAAHTLHIRITYIPYVSLT